MAGPQRTSTVPIVSAHFRSLTSFTKPEVHIVSPTVHVDLDAGPSHGHRL